MSGFELHTTAHPAFFLLCLLVGAGYAALLYYKTKGPWRLAWRRTLAAFRFLSVSLICYLLMEPYVRHTSSEAAKPLTAIVLDRSASIPLGEDSLRLTRLGEEVASLETALREAGKEVLVLDLQGTLTPADSFWYPGGQTDLSGALAALGQNIDVNNLTQVLLVSDGIVTAGLHPRGEDQPYPVYTLGLGDPRPRNDVAMRDLAHNRLAYKGNKFPLVARVVQTGFEGNATEVVLREGKSILARQPINLPADGVPQEVQFEIEAKTEGIHQYVVEVRAITGEYTTANNTLSAFVEVIDARDRVLIAALAPHPDVKAIRSALEEVSGLEVIVAVHSRGDRLPEGPFSAILLHQLPAYGGAGSDWLARLERMNVPLAYLAGTQSDLGQLDSRFAALEGDAQRPWSQEAKPTLNPNFTAFQPSSELSEAMKNWPPLLMPAASWTGGGSSVLLRDERRGAAMLYLDEAGGQRRSLFVGEGLWRWRLAEFAKNESHAAFDDLIQKWVQWQSVRKDRKRLDVRSLRRRYGQGQRVDVRVETYDQAYDPVYGVPAKIRLLQDGKEIRKYEATSSLASHQLSLSDLPAGAYTLEARANMNGQTQLARSAFIVDAYSLEASDLRANHDLLRGLSNSSGGRFAPVDSLDVLSDILLRDEPERLHSQTRTSPALHAWWLLALILTLLVAEWAARRYLGGY